MSTLGELLVMMGVDVSALRAGGAQAIGILNQVANVGTTGGARLTSSMATAERQIRATSGAAGILRNSVSTALGFTGALVTQRVIGEVIGAAAGAADAYREDEESISRLTASLRANVPAIQSQEGALERVISARMKLGFSDEEQRRSLALLAAATHDVNQALAIEATAMDLARLKGISLESAADALTRVEAGSYRILKSLGIELRDGATQTEALAAVQAIATGQAAQYAAANDGKLAASQVRVGEAAEKVGKILTDLQTAILPPVVSGIEFLADNADKLALVAGVLGSVVLVRLGMAALTTVGQFAAATVGSLALGSAYTGIATEAGFATVATTRLGIASRLVAAGPLAILLVALAAVHAAYGIIQGDIDKQTEALTATTTQYAKQASLADLIKARRQVSVDLAAAPTLMGWDVYGVKDKIQAQIDILDAEIERRSKLAGEHVPLAIAHGIAGKAGAVYDATKPLIEQFEASLAGVTEAAGLAGGNAMLDMAKGISDQQNAPLSALLDLHSAVKTQLTKTQQVALLMGMLTSADLAKGLASGDPAVYAQAVATKKLVTGRLDELTNGAYSAGANATTNLAAGITAAPALTKLASSLTGLGGAVSGFFKGLGWDQGAEIATGAAGAAARILQALGTGTQQMAVNAWDQYRPSAEDAAWASKYLAEQMTKLDGVTKGVTASAGSLRSALTSAFDEVKRRAHQMFDEMHQDNLRAIQDTRDLANAAVQGPVDAARAQLEAERAVRREAELRAAVANATSPADQSRAQQELSDFLADQRISTMQEEADAAKAVNDKTAEDARVAEDKRYKDQVASFDQQLAALRAYLAKHPGEWRKAQQEVLALLAKFGVDYKGAGEELGKQFAAGLRTAVVDVEDAARALAGAGTPAPKPKTSGGSTSGGWWPSGPRPPVIGGVTALASGAWNLLSDQMAWLHAGEMVVPRDVAGVLRSLVDGRGPAAYGGVSGGAGGLSPALAGVTGGGGGGTLIVQIGDEVLARITDERLYIRGGLTTVPVAR